MKIAAPSLPKSLPKIAVPKIDFHSIVDDFRHLNPNDPGAWPVVPKVTVLLSWFILILLAGWWFLWNDQLTELDTKAKEDIWFEEERFKKLGLELEGKTTLLAKAAETGDLKRIKAAFESARDTCSACHKAFRKT